MITIDSPLDARIAALYRKAVRITIETIEITPFGQDMMRTVHEGILARRSLFGDDQGADTVEFHFDGSNLPIILDVAQFKRASASFTLAPILPID